MRGWWWPCGVVVVLCVGAPHPAASAGSSTTLESAAFSAAASLGEGVQAQQAAQQAAAFEEWRRGYQALQVAHAGGMHAMYINMARSEDRKAHSERWLAREGLLPTQITRLDAVDAKLFHSPWRDLEGELAMQVTLPPCLQVTTFKMGSWNFPPVLAAGLSHLKSAAVAYAMGLEQVLILEDDMEAVPLSHYYRGMARAMEERHLQPLTTWEYIRHIITALPSDWQVLQLSPLVYNMQKARIVGDALLSGRLWSRRDRCSGTAFTVWGAGAYIVSRRGMEALLRRHLRPFLHATVEEAEAFCARLDLRHSGNGVVPDMILYDSAHIYTSHLPLFRPAPDISESTVQTVNPSFGDGYLQGKWFMQPAQMALQHALFAAAAAGSGADAADNSAPQCRAAGGDGAAAGGGQEYWRRSSGGGGGDSACPAEDAPSIGERPHHIFMLYPDLSVHGHHSNITHSGLPLPADVVNVTTAAERGRFYSLVDSIDARATPLWRRLLESYFSICGHATSVELSFDEYTQWWGEGARLRWLYLLLPLSTQLRGVRIPQCASDEYAQQAAHHFCTVFQHFEKEQADACTAQLHHMLQLALKRTMQMSECLESEQAAEQQV